MINTIKWTTEGLGTQWSFLVEADDGVSTHIQEEIEKQIRAFEGMYSRFDETSWLRQLRDVRGEVCAQREFMEMLTLYEKFSTITGGLFTPLGAALLSDLGYDQHYKLEAKSLSARATVQSAKDVYHLISDSKLEIRDTANFDLGALGKGYLIDQLGEFLRSRGTQKYIINGGGDILHCDTKQNSKSINVGLAHPTVVNHVLGSYPITNQAIASSSSCERAWGSEHHIFDPKRKQSTEDIIATWVVCDRAVIADAIATSLFLVTPECLLKEWDFEYLIVASSGVRSSESFSKVVGK